MSKYLIDYENVYIDGLDGLEKLTENDDVYIFYTENRCGLTFDLHKRLINSLAKIHLLEVSSAPKKNYSSKSANNSSVKNALDLQLTLFLGYLLSTDKEESESINIISNDKDFNLDVEFIANYLGLGNLEVGLYGSISSSFETEKSETDGTEPDNDLIELSLDYEDDDVSDENYESENSNTVSPSLMYSVSTLLQTNGIASSDDEDFVEAVCETIKNAADLLALNNGLANILHDSEKVKIVYKVIKPQFGILRNI